MNRYKITFNNGQTLLLYKPTQSDINIPLYENDFGGIQSITLHTDTSHLEYISKIKQQSKFLGYDTHNHEIYKCPYYKGYLVIQLAKDPDDNTYYDYAQYMEYKDNRFIEPVTKTMSTPEKVYNLISIKHPEYIIYSHRYYGEPKLSRPKELKGIKQLCSVDFIPKKCRTPIFIKDNDLWIKHSDYFSSEWRPPEGERIDMPLSYYVNKYLHRKVGEKFVYPDCWGSIVLRNEAWIQIKDIIPMIKTESHINVARTILKLQAKDNYSPHDLDSFCCEWNNYWENVIKEVQNIN